MMLSLAVTIIALVGATAVANGGSVKVHEGLHLRSLQEAPFNRAYNQSGGNCTERERDPQERYGDGSRNNMSHVACDPQYGNCDEDGHHTRTNCTGNNNGDCDHERVYDGTGPSGNMLQQTGRYWKHMMKRRFGHDDQQSNNNNLRHRQLVDDESEQDDEESENDGGWDRGQSSQDHPSRCSEDPETRDCHGDEDCTRQGPNFPDSARGNCTGLGDCDDNENDMDCDHGDGDCDGTGPNSHDGN